MGIGIPGHYYSLSAVHSRPTVGCTTTFINDGRVHFFERLGVIDEVQGKGCEPKITGMIRIDNFIKGITIKY